MEEASTLQIGSMAFSPVQCTSPRLHPCHRHLTKIGIKIVRHLPYSPDLAPCDFWIFPKLKEKLRSCRYETIVEMKEAMTKVIDTLTQEDFHGAFQKFWNGRTSAFQPEEITSKGTRVSCVYYQ